jgi:hypothetical protein
MRLSTVLLAAGILAGTVMPGWTGTSYVAPLGAKQACAKADGTQKCPWKSVSDALKNAKAGDTVLLMDGSHGGLDLNRFVFSSPVTLKSQNSKNAHIRFAHFGAETRNITLESMSVWRNEGEGAGFLIRAYGGSTGLAFINLDIRSRKDATNYLKWDLARWKSVASNAIDLRGRGYTLRGNTIVGVGRGIVVGSDSMVERNVIDGFTWDGLRGVSNSTFRDNLVKNCIRIDDVHRDGFQSYSKGDVDNLIIDGNVFIEWTHKVSYPLRGWMQGISLFDGFYNNLVIQNNLVVTQHSNGIAVLGSRDSKIVNNTVVHLSGKVNKYPIIRVKNHKDGRPSKNVTVSNNVASRFEGGSLANNVIFSNNTAITDPSRFFEDVKSFNYLPRAQSGLIDSGASGGPKVDIRGFRRPAGSGPDRGAYEARSSLVGSVPRSAVSALTSN